MFVLSMMSPGTNRDRDTTGDHRLELAPGPHTATQLQQIRERHAEG